MLLYACSNNFKDEDELKKWLSGKEFISTVKDFDHFNSNGGINSPVGKVVVKFYKDKVLYQNCKPCSYKIYQGQNNDIYAGKYWEINFEPVCTDGDDFSLTITDNGSYFLVSKAYDYDMEKIENISGTLSSVDAVLDRKKSKGPDMEIISETVIITDPIVNVNYDLQENYTQNNILKENSNLKKYAVPIKTIVNGIDFKIYSDADRKKEINNPYKIGSIFYMEGETNDSYCCYDPANSEDKFYIEKKNQQQNEIKTDTSMITIVKVKKSYFHSTTDYTSRKQSYIIEGDSVLIERKQDDFSYVAYKSKLGKVTRGWILTTDLK